MNYLYHRKPHDLQGDILYPLNTLKTIYPDLYNVKSEKYIGREFIMEQKIPILNCLWNDVLHFAAVHPQKILDVLKELGDDTVQLDMSSFEIDPNILEPEKTVVLLYKIEEGKDWMDESNFVPYNPADINKYSEIPEVTKEYYRESVQEKKRPLLHHGIPHILYKGNLNTKGLKVVNVNS